MRYDVGQIERRPLDTCAPLVAAAGEPATRFAAVTSLDDVEELAAADVDDLGRPALHPEPALPAEQGLVEAERREGVSDGVCKRSDRDLTGEH
ncbi:MAG: hypothetical protein V9E89_08880 [Ilumatobacteraceae bacterium]